MNKILYNLKSKLKKIAKNKILETNIYRTYLSLLKIKIDPERTSRTLYNKTPLAYLRLEGFSKNCVKIAIFCFVSLIFF